jgi:hypothetical protein
MTTNSLVGLAVKLRAILDARCVDPGDRIAVSSLREDWRAQGLVPATLDVVLAALETSGIAEVIPTPSGDALFVLGPVEPEGSDLPMDMMTGMPLGGSSAGRFHS